MNSQLPKPWSQASVYNSNPYILKRYFYVLNDLNDGTDKKYKLNISDILCWSVTKMYMSYHGKGVVMLHGFTVLFKVWIFF